MKKKPTGPMHCWHRAPDPRCEGFPVPSPIYRSALASMFVRDDEGEEMDTYRTDATAHMERAKAYVCCRCGHAHRGVKSVRVLWWTRKESVESLPPPCLPYTGPKSVDKLIHEGKETP